MQYKLGIDLGDKFIGLAVVMTTMNEADCISCNGCMNFQKLDMVKCAQLKR